MDDPFYQTAVILGVAALIGLAATRLRQPLIVSFIAVGILVGPAALGLIDDAEPLELFAEIGIAVLLFLVGLKLDVKLMRSTGPVALVTGLGQVAFTSIVGFLLAFVLGMDATTALYVAVALTFSSTIIIVKLLSDKGEIDELHGRIALGFLIVQDIVVVIVMIVLSTFDGGSDRALPVEMGLVVAKGAALAIGLAIVMRWILPWALHRVARSQELLLVSAVAWAVSVAALGDWMGFSTEVGAFLAGFALASTPFREAIGSSLSPLRDFLLLFFFIELGASLDFSSVGSQIPAAVLLSVFVLVGNPIIVLVIMGIMGYRKRVGFLAGLAVAQISEFSLIFVTLGRELGHIGDDTVGLVTMVGVITIGLSTYMILYSHPLYERLAPLLSIFERSEPTKEDDAERPEPPDVIVFGYGRFGGTVTRRLLEEDLRVLVVEWDPQALGADGDAEGLEVIYGDAENASFPASLPLSHVRAVVSTIPRAETNHILIATLRNHGYEGAIAVSSHAENDDDDAKMADEADLVLRPFTDAGEAAADRLLALLADHDDPEPSEAR